jgi:GNAT superfamily N-acetyltransferase
MNSTSFSFAYYINKSNPDSIKKHLLNCDKFFDPPLSSYVNIDEYSEKLFHRATNFEAWCNDELIGLVSMYCNDLRGKVAYISNVSTEADYQKYGIASRLLSKAIDYGEKLGFLSIRLDVYKRNAKARALYNKLGFEEENSDNQKLTMIKYI